MSAGIRRSAARLRMALAALLLGGAAAACDPVDMVDPKPLPVPMAASDITARLAGNTLYRSGWRGVVNWEYASHHSPDGRMAARVSWLGGEEAAQGRWKIDDNGLYCRTWSNHWAKGKEGCFRVYQSPGDGEVIFDHVSGEPGDSTRYEYSVLAGDPYGL